MLIAFGQNQRRAAFPDGLDDVIADDPIALIVSDKFTIEIVELNAHVWIRCLHWAEGGWADQHSVLKRMRGGLRLGVDAVAHGATLHEDDRMVAILTCDGGRKARYVSRLRPASHLLKALG